MKIGYASSDWGLSITHPETGHPTWGGAGWARCGLPATFLSAAGHDVVVGTLALNNATSRFVVRDWDGVLHDVDLLVMQRWMFASIAGELPDAVAAGQVVVNDVDDHFWALDPRNQAYRVSDPRTNLIENREHYLRVLQASSAVTTSTPYLADELRRLGVKVPIHVIENHIDLDAYEDIRRANRQRQGETVVGWIGGTPWRSGDLETLHGVLGPFVRNRGLRAYHGGHVEHGESFCSLTGVSEDVVTTRPLVPIWEYPSLFEGLDIGLVPLRDARFNRAKSWIKGLEYAAAGVPFVAAELPEYARFHCRYGVGRLAAKPRDWVKHLSTLLDPDVRAEEAEANLAGAKALDIRQGVSLWEDLYTGLLNGER